MQLRTSCPSRDIGLVGGCVQLPMGATTSGLGRSRFMTSCPGKDGSGVASSHPQSIGAAKGSVQGGPRSPSSWACQQSASCVQLSAMLRLPAPAAWIPASPPLPPTVCSWMHTCHCACTHIQAHRLAVSPSSPSPPANALASRHWYRCQSSEGRDADCPVLDLHVLSFDVF